MYNSSEMDRLNHQLGKLVLFFPCIYYIISYLNGCINIAFGNDGLQGDFNFNNLDVDDNKTKSFLGFFSYETFPIHVSYEDMEPYQFEHMLVKYMTGNMTGRRHRVKGSIIRVNNSIIYDIRCINL